MISIPQNLDIDRGFFWCHLYATIELEGLVLDEY